MAIIKINRTDLSADIDITAAEFERCTDIIENALDNAGIDYENLSFTADRWAFVLSDDANVDAAKSIIGIAIEGSLGQWTDDACLDAAVEFYKARRGKSGKTWWGEGFAGISDDVMADAGWLVLQDKKGAAGDILDAATQALDTDIGARDLTETAAKAFKLRETPADGTWFSERTDLFEAVPANIMEQAGRMIRRGEAYAAFALMREFDGHDDSDVEND